MIGHCPHCYQSFYSLTHWVQQLYSFIAPHYTLHFPPKSIFPHPDPKVYFWLNFLVQVFRCSQMFTRSICLYLFQIYQVQNLSTMNMIVLNLVSYCWLEYLLSLFLLLVYTWQGWILSLSGHQHWEHASCGQSYWRHEQSSATHGCWRSIHH